ncbi:putative disease resistance protein RGA4 [Dendrobium catenatum]|uniref:Disease resistance protein RGA4 n=1 Tax=Dendrobium catenatum TaxID=906689 RepID=A0A2I0WDH9_9ASPA|nr:putative disease resistance protein RGA4 [Dendrobium catenatum]PKU73713.1 Putative disease resistance protein RGA4 [Dendrobium catenatum]
MAMILEASMKKLSGSLGDSALGEVIMLLGVKDELQKLRELMENIRCLLKDAEKKRFDKSSTTELWLSKLKDVMYDADDIIDRCRIEGTLLLSDQNFESRTSSVCCDFLSAFSSCFTSVLLRHEIGNKMKDINERLEHIYEDRNHYKLEKSTISETPQFTRPDHNTSPLVDSYVVGREVEDVANSLVDRLVGEQVDEKCSVFALTGMGGIGKTTMAKKIFNHPKIQTYFNEKVWVCVSETYVETELLKQVIRGVNGRRHYENANSKAELEPILRNSIASAHSLFLVLDDVWRGNVWDELLRVPLQQSNVNVKILVTTRYENVAKEMKAVIHHVNCLSEESSWDMLRRQLFSKQEEELANDLKDLGLKIVSKCEGLPLAIKVIAGVLVTKECTRKEWQNFLRNYAWSSSELSDEQIRGALRLSFEDLPSHLKQCFLYFSLYPEDAKLDMQEFALLWVAEGFITEQQDTLMEDLAKQLFNELLNRNLLLLGDGTGLVCQMHDLIRYLAIFYSKEETSFGNLNVRNSSKSAKLRRLSVANQEAAVETLDSIADQGALRTLLASRSNLLLDDERLRRLSHLRVLDISDTKIQVLSDSIGNLMHLRYLNLKYTQIRAIPKSIGQLTNLQFLDLSFCIYLTEIPSEVTLLHNLRRLDINETPLSFIPKGIDKLQQLNYLSGFVVSNNDSSSSKLEELNSLKHIRTLNIGELKRPQSETIVLKELPYLCTLKLKFSADNLSPNEEQELEVEKLFNKIIPSQSLEDFTISGYFGLRFPSWMFTSFEIFLPNLTKLVFVGITSCTLLPALGQLPKLRELVIKGASKVEKIGPEFFVSYDKATKIAFPNLEQLVIVDFPNLKEWSFGAQVEQNARLPCLQKLTIGQCELLKQLPEDLKYSPIKFLKIFETRSLKSVGNLPAQIEELELRQCGNLEKIFCPPTLKALFVLECNALAYVEKLDSLKKLGFTNIYSDGGLPEWLLKLLRQRRLQNDSNDSFELWLTCTKEVFPECLKGGSYWDLIQHIPQVSCWGFDYAYYLRYSKQPYVYETNFYDNFF